MRLEMGGRDPVTARRRLRVDPKPVVQASRTSPLAVRFVSWRCAISFRAVLACLTPPFLAGDPPEIAIDEANSQDGLGGGDGAGGTSGDGAEVTYPPGFDPDEVVTFAITLRLCEGWYAYKFVVDGKPRTWW